MQLELVPAPITLAAEFSKVLDVPHSLPLPPRIVVHFFASRGNINIANLKYRSHPVLSSQRVRQPNIVQLIENYRYIYSNLPFLPLGTTNSFLASPNVPTDLQQFSSKRTAQAPVILASVFTFSKYLSQP